MRKSENKHRNTIVRHPHSAVLKLEQYQGQANQITLATDTTQSTNKKTQTDVIDDSGNNSNETNRDNNNYRDKMYDSKLETIRSDISNKTSEIKNEIIRDVNTIKDSLTEKIDRNLKWVIGVNVTIILFAIGFFQYLISNKTSELEDKFKENSKKLVDSIITNYKPIKLNPKNEPTNTRR